MPFYLVSFIDHLLALIRIFHLNFATTCLLNLPLMCAICSSQFETTSAPLQGHRRDVRLFFIWPFYKQCVILHQEGPYAGLCIQKYGLDKSMVSRAVQGHGGIGKKPGRKPSFSAEEEQFLVQYVIKNQKRERCVTLTMLRSEAINIIKRRGWRKGQGAAVTQWRKDGFVAHSWVRSFLKRHPTIVKRKSDPTSNTRRGVPIEKVENFFSQLADIRTKYPKLPRGNYVNLDETCLCAWDSKRTVLAVKGSRNTRGPENESREGITCLLAVTALGRLLTPFLVTKGSDGKVPHW